jgi:hypothetical protein
MIVNNPGNMARRTNPGPFGSHFNYLENHPMCADSALDINMFQFFAAFVGNIFRSDEYIYVIDCRTGSLHLGPCVPHIGIVSFRHLQRHSAPTGARDLY